MSVQANGNFLIDAAMKAQQWEIAKGHLRALVELQGSYSSGIPTHMETETPKWKRLKAVVEAFVKKIEDDALQE